MCKFGDRVFRGWRAVDHNPTRERGIDPSLTRRVMTSDGSQSALKNPTGHGENRSCTG